MSLSRNHNKDNKYKYTYESKNIDSKTCYHKRCTEENVHLTYKHVYSLKVMLQC